MFNPPKYNSKESFLKPRLGPWTIVLFLHRKKILNSLLKARPFIKGKLLDVGCGNKPYKSLLEVDSYTGVDVATTSHNQEVVDVFFDGLQLPFENEKFDSVLCTEVLEHCVDPVILMNEIYRVLKVNGTAFITVPMFIEHHEIPYDHRRLTYYGMKALAESNGLKVEFIDHRGNVFITMVAAINMAISQVLSRRPFSDLIHWVFFPFFYLFIN